MKIEAGFELKIKNPSNAAAKIAIIKASTGCPLTTKLSVKKHEPMAAIPAARPSILSSRLMAFVMPISQKIVIAMFTETDLVQGRLRP